MPFGRFINLHVSISRFWNQRKWTVVTKGWAFLHCMDSENMCRIITKSVKNWKSLKTNCPKTNWTRMPWTCTKCSLHISQWNILKKITKFLKMKSSQQSRKFRRFRFKTIYEVFWISLLTLLCKFWNGCRFWETIGLPNQIVKNWIKTQRLEN